MSEKLDAEISRLKKEHTRLDNEIDKMEKTGHFEDLKLTQLKKQKARDLSWEDLLKSEKGKLKKVAVAEAEDLTETETETETEAVRQ